MEPIDYGGALRRSWRLLIALAIVGAIVAVLVPVGHTKKVKNPLPYQAIAIVGTAPQGSGSPLNGAVSAGQIQFLASEIGNQAQIASASGLDIPDAALPLYMSATSAPSTGAFSAAGATATKGAVRRNTPTVVELTGRGATAAAAVSLANNYANGMAYVVAGAASDRSQGTNSNPYTGYQIIQPALAATHVSNKTKASLSASRKVRGLAGLVIGAIVAAVIILLRELLDKRLRNASRTEANFGFPVVAEIPSAALNPGATVSRVAPMVDVIRDPTSAGAEAYRMLRMSVMFEGLASLAGPTDPYALGFDLANPAHGSDSPSPDSQAASEVGERHVILVVSAGSEPSRPYVAANLAAIYAEAGDRVLVVSTGEVEAGRGRKTVDVTSEIRPEDIEAHLEPSRLEQVSRLPLTPFVSRSGQLVTRMPSILDAARQVSDVIIVEVPPLLKVHHAEALFRAADVVLVVAECRFTTFDHARRAGDLLRRMGAPVLGVVLTGTKGDGAEPAPPALQSADGPTQDSPPDDTAVMAAVGAGGEPSEPTAQTDT